MISVSARLKINFCAISRNERFLTARDRLQMLEPLELISHDSLLHLKKIPAQTPTEPIDVQQTIMMSMPHQLMITAPFPIPRMFHDAAPDHVQLNIEQAIE